MEKFAAWEKAGEGSWARLKEVGGRLVDGGPESQRKKKLSAQRQRRREAEDEPGGVARGLIRQLVLIIDASRAARIADLRPTRMGATIAACSDFASKFLATNPVSSLAVVEASKGSASRLSRLSGAKGPHVKAIKSLGDPTSGRFPPAGDFSLSAALEEARFVLANESPDYGRREILLVVSSLTTIDGEDVFAKTVARLAKLRVAVNVVSLSAETHIFKTLAAQHDGTFTVALDRPHFAKLLDAHVPPPKVVKAPPPSSKRKRKENDDGPDDDDPDDTRLRPTLIEMGFPTLRVDAACPKLCAIATEDTAESSTLQVEWKTTTFACPRCATRVAALPCNCPVCRLPLVQAAHLAASYHHLFPVPRFTEVNVLGDDVPASLKRAETCFGCFDPLYPASAVLPGAKDDDDGDGDTTKKTGKKKKKPLQRTLTTDDDAPAIHIYVCPKCDTPFCAACDEYIHTSLHNCPACDSARPR